MKAIRIFHPPKEYSPGIHATAVIAESARVDPSAHIGPNVVIEESVTVGKRSAVLATAFVGEEVQIGDECLIYPNVTIREQSIIGDRVIVHSGTVIGPSIGGALATYVGLKAPYLFCAVMIVVGLPVQALILRRKQGTA